MFASRTALAVFAILATLAPASAQSLTAEQLARFKTASVFLKVKAGDDYGTGSGFVVKNANGATYVVTNFHVVDLGEGSEPTITAVFNSGANGERSSTAELVAVDPERDLAVLKIAGLREPPTPLDLADPPELLETMRVFVCGFPFGERLGRNAKNPEISINQASISSIRKDTNGKLSQLQLDGQLNPGNSGGPVVTAEGKLVGVARARIRDAGIGFAIPQQEVTATLNGRFGRIRLNPPADGEARGTLRVLLIDPLKTIKTVTAHVLPPSDEKPEVPAGVMAVAPGATAVPLSTAGLVASAPVAIPPGKSSIWVQLEWQTATATRVSAPVEVKSVAPANPNGPARLPVIPNLGPPLPPPTEYLPQPDPNGVELSILNRTPEKYVDKPLTVDALSGGVQARDDGYELDISFESGKGPSNVKVTIPKDLALQVHDLGILPEDKFAVRLTGTLKKPVRGDSRHLLAAETIAFVDGRGRPVTTMKVEPAPAKLEPSLATINRFPDKFVGQTVVLDALFKGVGFAGQGHEVKIFNFLDAKPLNLEFYTSKDVATQIEDEVTRGTLLVKVTGSVERVSPKTGKGIVGVSKIVILNPSTGLPAKELKSMDEIKFPYEAPPPPARPTTPTAPRPAPKPAEPPADTGSGSTMIVVAVASVLLGLGVIGVGVFLMFRRSAEAAEVVEKPPVADDDYPEFG